MRSSPLLELLRISDFALFGSIRPRHLPATRGRGAGGSVVRCGFVYGTPTRIIYGGPSSSAIFSSRNPEQSQGVLTPPPRIPYGCTVIPSQGHFEIMSSLFRWPRARRGCKSLRLLACFDEKGERIRLLYPTKIQITLFSFWQAVPHLHRTSPRDSGYAPKRSPGQRDDSIYSTPSPMYTRHA